MGREGCIGAHQECSCRRWEGSVCGWDRAQPGAELPGDTRGAQACIPHPRQQRQVARASNGRGPARPRCKPQRGAEQMGVLPTCRQTNECA